jgi:hypothetical protein
MAPYTPVALIAAFCLMTGAASAQVAMGAAPGPGVRYNPAPPRPDPPRANPDTRPNEQHHPKPHHAPDMTTERDVFLAGPETYKPRRGERRSAGPFFYPGPVVPEVVFVETIAPAVTVERTKVVYVETPVEREPAAAPALPAAPAPRRAGPTTLYVIPRCYAGDKPPAARDLPAGCDVRDLRIIRP